MASLANATHPSHRRAFTVVAREADGEDWALRQTLVPVGPFYEFGSAVTTDGTWIAVGSPWRCRSRAPTTCLSPSSSRFARAGS